MPARRRGGPRAEAKNGGMRVSTGDDRGGRDGGDDADELEQEPDYRFSLANERTFLAWIRTALALLAGGVALNEVEHLELSGARRTIAVAVTSLSLVLAVAAFARWAQVQRAMRRGQPLPKPAAVPLLAGGVAVVAAVILLVMVVG